MMTKGNKIATILFLFGWSVFSFNGISKNYKTYSFLDWVVILCVIAAPFAVLLTTRALRKKRRLKKSLCTMNPATLAAQQSAGNAATPDTYIKDGNTIYRTDGEAISDAEMPYLIQQGYKDAVRKEEQSANPKYHRTEREEELSFQFSFSSSKSAKAHSLIEAFEKAHDEARQIDDVNIKINKLNEALTLFKMAKKYCYSCGVGGTIYFQDMWEYMHNSQNECFSYTDIIQKEIDSIENIHFHIAPLIKETISANPDILQKNIYAILPNISKSEIQYVIRLLETNGEILRTKKSNSFLLELS